MLLNEPRRGNSLIVAQGSLLYKFDNGLIFSEEVKDPKLAMFINFDNEDFARIIIEDKIRFVKVEDLREVKNDC